MILDKVLEDDDPEEVMMSTWNDRSLMSTRWSLLLRLPYWTPKLDEK